VTGIRSRLLALVVALALLPVTGCGGDDTPGRSAAGKRRTPADATGSTLPGDGLAAGGPTSTGGSGDSEVSAQSDTSKASSGRAAPGTATGKPGGGTPTTTASGSGSTTTTTTAAPVGGCPDPRGCPHYKLIGGRWPRDAGGVATIRYRVKADGHAPVNVAPLTPEQTIAAVQKAAQAWMDAVPSVRLVYDGTTAADPKGGNNVVGWAGPTSTPGPGLAGAEFTPQREGPTYTGFSITLDRNAAYTVRPCDPARGQPCDDDQYKGYDLVGILTHEWGHALGLDHVEDLERDAELTMCPVCGQNLRHYVTLGLGDILGARSLYPTNAPIPTLYRP
jgi:hypothetical protein